MFRIILYCNKINLRLFVSYWFCAQCTIICFFCVGDAIVDGGTIKWETHKQFEGLTDDEISALSLQDYEQLEAERMQKNAWRVTDQLVMRLDDAPVHSEFIRL